MFGRRRRRPILGVALVAGTATAAARHGARKQSQMEADRQFQMEQEIEFRRNAEEREQLRTQRTVDQAVNDALLKQQPAGNNSQMEPASSSGQRPAPGPPPTYTGPDSFASPSGFPSSPYLHPAAAAAPGPPRPRSTSAVDSNICFCMECGTRCGVQDNFCGRCGRSLSREDFDQPAKQGA